MSAYRYVGDGRSSESRHPQALELPEPYNPDPKLVEAVNLAIYLERPLLLEGEAGSGKSRLAYAVAYELGLPLYVWSVRSTSHARDGLYTYDGLLRLHDVHAGEKGRGRRDPSDSTYYRKFGALGEAFRLEEYPAIVLIDEIDKADLDFPNDLLTVIEKPREFDIPETGEKIKAKFAPIVIITSNKEKGNLPSPFLRRCVYAYVRFPEDPETLKKIVEMHMQEMYQRPVTGDGEQQLVHRAVLLFLKIRELGTSITKLPSTSELIDWIRALLDYGSEPYGAHALPVEVTADIPYPELLFKLRTDLARLPRA